MAKKDESLAELFSKVGAKDSGEGMTTKEIMKATGKGMNWVLTKLKEADEAGMLIKSKGYRTNLVGIRQPAHLFSFKKRG